MSQRTALVGICVVVVVICIVTTVTMFGIGRALDDPVEYPSYEVSGHGPGDESFTGTATCTDIRESETSPVLRFDYTIRLEDGTTATFQSYILLNSQGFPNDNYTRGDRTETNGVWTTLWQHKTDGLWYCFTDSGNLLWFTFDVDGYSGMATVIT